jgi:hypothetical protein
MGIAAKLTQVATLVEDLPAADAQIRSLFGFDEGYHEIGMAMFGLENTVQPIGQDQYLEVCGRLPAEAGSKPVGGRRGNGGYMAIIELPNREDVAVCRERLLAQGLRIVHEITQENYESIHVHPRDLGTIVSFDWNNGPWPGIAADWEGPRRIDVVQGIQAVELRSSSSKVLAERWRAVLDAPLKDGDLSLTGDGTTIRFREGRPDNEAGLDVIDFAAADRNRAGKTVDVGGTEFRLV